MRLLLELLENGLVLLLVRQPPPVKLRKHLPALRREPDPLHRADPREPLQPKGQAFGPGAGSCAFHLSAQTIAESAHNLSTKGRGRGRTSQPTQTQRLGVRSGDIG